MLLVPKQEKNLPLSAHYFVKCIIYVRLDSKRKREGQIPGGRRGVGLLAVSPLNDSILVFILLLISSSFSFILFT